MLYTMMCQENRQTQEQANPMQAFLSFQFSELELFSIY